MIQAILLWFKSIVNAVGDLANWLTQPISFLGVTITPLGLVGIAGLLVFVGLAIANWVIK